MRGIFGFVASRTVVSGVGYHQPTHVTRAALGDQARHPKHFSHKDPRPSYQETDHSWWLMFILVLVAVVVHGQTQIDRLARSASAAGLSKSFLGASSTPVGPSPAHGGTQARGFVAPP